MCSPAKINARQIAEGRDRFGREPYPPQRAAGGGGDDTPPGRRVRAHRPIWKLEGVGRQRGLRRSGKRVGEGEGA
jgi:hypothetical protein